MIVVYTFNLDGKFLSSTIREHAYVWGFSPKIMKII